MLTIDRRLHAFLSLFVLGCAIFVVFFPICAALVSVADKQNRVSNKKETIASLEARLYEERKKASNSASDQNLTNALGAYPTQNQITDSTCGELANKFNQVDNSVTPSCSFEISPIDDQFALHTVDMSVTGPIENLLSSFDRVELGALQIEELQLSATDDGKLGALRLKLVSFGKNAEMPAE